MRKFFLNQHKLSIRGTIYIVAPNCFKQRRNNLCQYSPHRTELASVGQRYRSQFRKSDVKNAQLILEASEMRPRDAPLFVKRRHPNRRRLTCTLLPFNIVTKTDLA